MTAHSWWCRLRWSDMDAYGHVNNVQFLRYLEDARVAMLFHEHTVSDGDREVLSPSFESQLVVVRHEIDYRRPLVYRPEPVLIRTTVVGLNAGSVTLAYEIADDDSADAVTYATARSRLAAYDLDRGRPRRFTPAERRRLECLRD